MPGVAVHFGAGNIGRGFVGLILHRAGYQVVFADVVDALNRTPTYRVKAVGLDSSEEVVLCANGDGAEPALTSWLTWSRDLDALDHD
jgi:mannitol-1-phosphate/altronate dehydrogenase